ncbi:hypothetical protein N802_18265 [Knoellia sinensis KCTC 19936]|uniref:Hydrolase n=1 Tax=Knoellia sinensis KCTC 19936 TaxID=1385520 RepID=A0A0A0J696_9MICO|nr:HAD family hydrolase [Knoellia sinensis]KGN32309.1 hypothetical protein N802_18265 [Knoellia sinensis KCTC 19936]
MFKVLLLELDGVLRFWDPTLTEAVEASYGLPAGALALAAFAPHRFDPALTGTIDDQTWRESVARNLSLDDVDTARAAVQAWMGPVGRVDPDVLDVVRLARTTVRVVLLTNATNRLQDDLERLGLTDEIDDAMSSAQLGLAKPDPDVFSRAALRNGLMFSEIAYVDASPVNIATAEILGIRSHRYVGVDEFRTFVDDVLIDA